MGGSSGDVLRDREWRLMGNIWLLCCAGFEILLILLHAEITTHVIVMAFAAFVVVMLAVTPVHPQDRQAE